MQQREHSLVPSGASARASAERHKRELRVLLLASQAADLALARWLLEHDPAFVIERATTLAGAQARLSESRFDVLVAALAVADAQGARLVRRLQETCPAVPIVMLAHTADDPRLGKALDAGAEDCVIGASGAVALRTVRRAIERRHVAARLEYLSRYDKLTGLSNRELLADRLAMAMGRAERSGRELGLLLVDVDCFRSINEVFGHEFGDSVLITVAARLTDGIRRVDTVARTGANEFAVVVEDIEHETDFDTVCRKVQAAIAEPISVAADEVYLTCSIGVVIYPGDGTNLRSLMCNADYALEQAKRRGRGGVVHYRTGIDEPASERGRIERELGPALELGQFELRFQPRVSMRTGEVRGMEALLRWNHPQLGLLLPARFVPLAEQMGFIDVLGEWVIRSACDALECLAASGYRELNIGINLSPRQFQRGDLAETIERIIAERGIAPERLLFEITESTVMEDTAASALQLDRLKAMGVALYLDDFGTGYSSLSYLKRFPLDGLKIDRSFIRDIPHDADDVAITRAVIALGRALQLQVVAEGVESSAQLEFVEAECCDEAQGRLFSEALALADLLGWLAERDVGRLRGTPF